MTHPGLDVSDAGASDPTIGALLTDRTKLSSTDKIIERQLMCLLIAMYERAYIRYADQTDDFKREQWSGWLSGLTRWCQRDSFRSAWAAIGRDFDARFQTLVKSRLV